MSLAIETPKKAPPYRLHFAVVGDFIECRYAQMDTLHGSVLLGTLRHGLAESDPSLWEGWKLMMRRSFRDEIQRMTGVNIVTPKQEGTS